MTFGLIGKSLSHSFSKSYFSKKFEEQKLSTHQYQNFELERIEDFPALLINQPKLKGLNVTIPYKKAIIPYLDQLSEEAQRIGAVNTIKISEGKLIGYNTDWWGFTESIQAHLQTHHQRCLVLGSGGASAAVVYGLSQLGMTSLIVSRQPEIDEVDYKSASKLVDQHFVIINCTPAGTWPNIEEMPALDLSHINEKHLVYDLIYNPPESKLLRLTKEKGAQVLNGAKMLEFQAEKAWAIWNEL